MALGDEDFFDVANRGRKPVKASHRVPGNTPYYGANNIQDYVDGYTHDGEYVLIAEDGSASLERYSIQYATGKFWANNHIHVVCGKQGLSTRFLYHYLCIVNFIPFLSGGGRAKLTKGKMVEIQIPIPCPENPEKSLAIQAEIVRILDTFTELTTELSARKKQYNYYRDQLLSFTPPHHPALAGTPPEEGNGHISEGEEACLSGRQVEWKTLGDIIIKSYSGGTPTAGNPEYYDGGTISWLRTQEVKFSDIKRTEVKITSSALENSAAKWIPENCVIVAISGATAGRSAINKIP